VPGRKDGDLIACRGDRMNVKTVPPSSVWQRKGCVRALIPRGKEEKPEADALPYVETL